MTQSENGSYVTIQSYALWEGSMLGAEQLCKTSSCLALGCKRFSRSEMAREEALTR